MFLHVTGDGVIHMPKTRSIKMSLHSTFLLCPVPEAPQLPAPDDDVFRVSAVTTTRDDGNSAHAQLLRRSLSDPKDAMNTDEVESLLMRREGGGDAARDALLTGSPTSKYAFVNNLQHYNQS